MFQQVPGIGPVLRCWFPVIVPIPGACILPALEHHPAYRIRKRRVVDPVKDNRTHVELLLIRIRLGLPTDYMG